MTAEESSELVMLQDWTVVCSVLVLSTHTERIRGSVQKSWPKLSFYWARTKEYLCIKN